MTVAKEDVAVRKLLDAVVAAHVRSKNPKLSSEQRAEAFARMVKACKALSKTK